MKQQLQNKRQVGIYIHIPFCVRKCAYCDFLSAPAEAAVRERYVQELVREIRGFQENRETAENLEIISIFLGGGTPSLLMAGQAASILEAVGDVFPVTPGAEITAECNPGALSDDWLGGVRRAGVNRLSMGLQSADNRLLRILGRIHTWEQFLENYAAARKAGFENINIDLMSSLPGQTAQDWLDTLHQVCALKPEHISAYSLIIEPGTPFYDLYHEEDERRSAGEEVPHLPSEETERQMYEDTLRFLERYGYHRYEISNYALPGRESVHNSGYWTRRDYIGFGLGSAPLLDDCRYRNTDDLEAYLAGDHARYEQQILTRKDRMEEMMFLGLRMMKGVSVTEFADCFGISPEHVYGEKISRLQEEGLLEISAGRIRLTKRGIPVSNMVMAQFLLD